MATTTTMNTHSSYSNDNNLLPRHPLVHHPYDISTSPTGAVSSDAVAMLPPTTSLSISNFPPSSSRLSSPLVTSLITSFHHSVRFGDLAILTRVNVVMMTLIYSSVDSDDENNNENDGNDNDV
ncbi:hypothetical protein V8E54_004536 [Elaphomyces granulatus]